MPLSKTCKHSLNPKWSESLSLNVRSEKETLIVKLYDEDRIGKDDFIGQALVPLSDISLDGTPMGFDLTLQLHTKQQPTGGATRASVAVELTFNPQLASGVRMEPILELNENCYNTPHIAASSVAVRGAAPLGIMPSSASSCRCTDACAGDSLSPRSCSASADASLISFVTSFTLAGVSGRWRSSGDLGGRFRRGAASSDAPARLGASMPMPAKTAAGSKAAAGSTRKFCGVLGAGAGCCSNSDAERRSDADADQPGERVVRLHRAAGRSGRRGRQTRSDRRDR